MWVCAHVSVHVHMCVCMFAHGGMVAWLHGGHGCTCVCMVAWLHVLHG